MVMENPQAALWDGGLRQISMQQCEDGEQMQISVVESREKEWQEAKKNDGKLIVQP